MSTAIDKLQRAYEKALRKEESANTTEKAQQLATKTERISNQIRLAKVGKLPPVAKKVEKRLEQMVRNNTYEEVVEFISEHHYGGCGCGCGEAVTRLFRQGHDMKLKSRMKNIRKEAAS